MGDERRDEGVGLDEGLELEPLGVGAEERAAGEGDEEDGKEETHGAGG